MVDINKVTITPAAATPQTRTNAVETHTDERRAEPRPKPYVERRKNPDRRRKDSQRPLYDMRGSRGRRKTDGEFISIDVDV